VEKTRQRESFSPAQKLELEQQLVVVSYLPDLPDKIIVPEFTVVAAVGAIGIEAVAHQAVVGPYDIQDLHIRWITNTFKPKCANDLEIFRPVNISIVHRKSLWGPPEFIVHIFFAKPIEYL
jgi:hypothetical protein